MLRDPDDHLDLPNPCNSVVFARPKANSSIGCSYEVEQIRCHPWWPPMNSGPRSGIARLSMAAVPITLTGIGSACWRPLLPLLARLLEFLVDDPAHDHELGWVCDSWTSAKCGVGPIWGSKKGVLTFFASPWVGSRKSRNASLVEAIFPWLPY